MASISSLIGLSIAGRIRLIGRNDIPSLRLNLAKSTLATYHGSDPRWLVEYLLCRGERKLFHGCELGTKYRWGVWTLLGLSPNGKTNLGWYHDSTPPANRYSTSTSTKKYPPKSFAIVDHAYV